MYRNALISMTLAAAACATPMASAPTPSPVDARFVARQAAMATMAQNFDRVHFEFDSSAITVDTRDALFANVDLMRSFPEISVEVEGHCDEVGSIEYNLALGQRRAEAIRRYMVAAGVAQARVQTISFGKELPLDMSKPGGAQVINRRAEFRLSYAPHPQVEGSVAAIEFEPAVVIAQNH